MRHATRNRRRERFWESFFRKICLAAVALPLLILAGLLLNVLLDAAQRIDWSFISSYPSRKPALAGILPALVGSFYLVSLTAAIALPLGIGAAIYLQEYRGRSRIASLIEVNIANLAGVPSVIYGLLGLGLFVRTVGMGRSLIAGACTLALLVMPIVIMTAREALRTVPNTLREAAFALGATRWQAIRRVVMPQALPSILTGAILAISRAIGETAPLIVVGALTFVTFLPDGIDAPFTALPIQIFNWVSRPQKAFLYNAAAGIVVLLATMLVLNAIAVYFRHRLQRRWS
ncbi:MAG: phosphate ABC transporter permease PstA [Deltaproteobacteria bacterium]|nr:phosphate ABC transporter permease PstA [Deltaproteobacteria bacterium]